MGEAKRWTIVVDIEHYDGRVRAVARLYMRETDRMVGVGTVHLNPDERDVPAVGAEMATAGALAQLSRLLLHAATEDAERSAAWSPEGSPVIEVRPAEV